MQEAKLMLRHTDKLVYQIADELNFPNASFSASISDAWQE